MGTIIKEADEKGRTFVGSQAVGLQELFAPQNVCLHLCAPVSKHETVLLACQNAMGHFFITASNVTTDHPRHPGIRRACSRLSDAARPIVWMCLSRDRA